MYSANLQSQTQKQIPPKKQNWDNLIILWKEQKEFF